MLWYTVYLFDGMVCICLPKTVAIPDEWTSCADPDNSGNAYATTNHLPPPILCSRSTGRCLVGSWWLWILKRNYSHSKLPDGLGVWTCCLFLDFGQFVGWYDLEKCPRRDLGWLSCHVLSSQSFSRYLIKVCIADNAVLACWFTSCPLASPNTSNTLKSQLESAASQNMDTLDMENHGAFNMAHIAALKMVLLNSPVTGHPVPFQSSSRQGAPQITCSDTSGAASNKTCTSVRCRNHSDSGITAICGVGTRNLGIWIYFGCIFFGWFFRVSGHRNATARRHKRTHVTSKYSCSLSCWLAATCSTWQKALHATACSPLGRSFPGSCTQIAIAPAAVGDDPDYRPAEWLEGIHFGRRKSRTKRQWIRHAFWHWAKEPHIRWSPETADQVRECGGRQSCFELTLNHW